MGGLLARPSPYIAGATHPAGASGGQAAGAGIQGAGPTGGGQGRRWGGRLPHERVRRINGALELARLDRELVDGITDLDLATQRAVGEAFRLLDADPHVRCTSVASYDGRHERLSQQHMAVPALWSAAADDPLGAGLESLFHAMVTFGIDYRRLLSEVRDVFPELAERGPGGGRGPW